MSHSLDRTNNSVSRRRSVARISVLLVALAVCTLAIASVGVSSHSVKSGMVSSPSATSDRSGRVKHRIAGRGPATATSVALVSKSLSLPLASITVDRTDDTFTASACTAAANDCSLRGAVAFANLNPGTTINVPPGTYQLNIAGGAVEGFNGDDSIGDLDVTASGTNIVGSGAATTIIHQTQPNDRVIEVNPFLDAAFTFSISSVTISGGRETTAVGGGGMIAGAIDNVTTATDCVFSSNSATGAGTFGGGGISLSGGSLTLNGCTFTGNSTSGSGGGIGYSAGDPLGRTPSAGILTVTNSTFTSNTATSAGAGGGGADLFDYNQSSSVFNFTGSSFQGNTATNGNGGAIIVESGGPLTINTSSFAANNAAHFGGAISSNGAGTNVAYSRLVGNIVPSPANGLTIYRAAGTLTAENNWWGINSGAGANDVRASSGTVFVTSWLQLEHSANPGSICAGATSTLTADIKRTNSGLNLTVELDGLPAFPVPPGAIFSGAVLGTLSGASTQFVNGAASATFTAGPTEGTGSVNATADNETVPATIIVASTTATQPADQIVCQGVTANFSTTASGTGPFTYQWKLDGNNIAGATNSTVGIDTTALSGGNHTVDVVVTGACGSVTKSATLTVNTTPVVTTNPVSQTIVSGNVTFTAAASGLPAPTVQWEVSTNGGGSFSPIPGATSTSLTFATNPSQNGNQYRAVFTNTCGTATSSAATLTTCTPAAIVTNPVSVVDACVGAVVNFTASASGVPTPTVQWQVSTNGGGSFANISGATSTTLSVTASVAVRNNQYRAVFTNDCGTATSTAAILGVDTIAPVITLNGQTISLWPPNHSYHTVNVTDLVASASDNCNANLLSSVVIASVSSDEPENGGGDGNTFNDIVIGADCKSVQLRAERVTNGNGRVYRITFKVTDSAGNTTTVMAKVSVPTTQNGAAAIDDGPGAGYTVNGACP